MYYYYCVYHNNFDTLLPPLLYMPVPACIPQPSQPYPTPIHITTFMPLLFFPLLCVPVPIVCIIDGITLLPLLPLRVELIVPCGARHYSVYLYCMVGS